MPDIVEDTIEALAPPADAGSSRKQGNKPSSSSRSRSRKMIQEQPEDEHEQTDEEREQPKKRSRANTRSLRRSVSTKRNPSSRGKKIIPTVSEEEELAEATPTRSTITNPKSRSRRSADEDTNQHETERNVLMNSTLTKKSSKSSSRSNKKSTLVPSPSLEDYTTAPEEVAEEDQNGEEEDSSVALTRKGPSSRSITKAKTPKDPPVTEEDKEAEERQILVTPKTRKTTTISLERSTTTTREKKNNTTEMTDDVDKDNGGDERGKLTSTNLEDEVEAGLEDIPLDGPGMGDHITEETPQEQDAIDEEAILFAPRLVTKASEAEQQRPRTPSLVPFAKMAGSVSSFPGGIDLDMNVAGSEEEKKSEVKVEMIPKTPPRKFVDDEGGSVPLIPSPDRNADLTINVSVGVAEVEHLAPQSKFEQVQPQQPQLVPVLSKLPFVPLDVLTGAELDMTVEDWIRYQMEVEYDKFKRDGERELMRFRKKAEETRKIIEGL